MKRGLFLVATVLFAATCAMGQPVEDEGVGTTAVSETSVGVAGAWAQEFAGTWALNKTSSSGDLKKLPDKMTVTVDAKQLVYVMNGKKASRSAFSLDGTETTRDIDEPMIVTKIKNTLRSIDNGQALELTSVHSWEGKQSTSGAITTTIVVKTPPRTSRQVWTLRDQGKVLLVKWDDGRSLVYDKQGKR